MSEPQSSIDHQQRRGAGWDAVDEAIAAYDEWMLDDDYDAMTILHEIMWRLRARRSLYDTDIASPPGEDQCNS